MPAPKWRNVKSAATRSVPAGWDYSASQWYSSLKSLKQFSQTQW